MRRLHHVMTWLWRGRSGGGRAVVFSALRIGYNFFEMKVSDCLPYKKKFCCEMLCQYLFQDLAVLVVASGFPSDDDGGGGGGILIYFTSEKDSGLHTHP